MKGRNKRYKKKELEEQVIQKLPYRCPYCDHPITYDDLHLRPGENEIKCPSCQRTYIKIVPDSSAKRKKK
jgi:transposase-like protein